MKISEIKEIAQRMEVSAGKMKKSDLIRVIQRKEGNLDCFESGRSVHCGQEECLWRADCR